MRERRAQRLLLRAEVAAEAGCPEDAQQCLDEARLLAPNFPGIAAAEALIAAAATVEPPRSEAPVEGDGFRRRALYAAAAVAALLLLAVPLIWQRHAQVSTPPLTAPTVPYTASTASTAVASTPAAEPPQPTATFVEPVTPAVPEPAPAHDEAPARLEKASAPSVPSDPLPQETRRSTEADTRPLPPVTPALNLRASVSDAIAAPPPTVPVSAPEPPLAPAPALAAPEPASRLPVPSSPAPVAPSQEPLVRSVLNRYASAYSALDVDAAARVWPGVNRGALSRAFDSLASQRVSLGDCRIDVSGATAEARCAGTATWSPKVGSGSRTEAREWMFQLSRDGGDWQIVSARVQNK